MFIFPDHFLNYYKGYELMVEKVLLAEKYLQIYSLQIAICSFQFGGTHVV